MIYLGDLKHQPYGTRLRSEIVQLSEKAVSFLLDMGAQEIFIACNTISSNALGSLRSKFSVPIHGITEWVRYYKRPKDERVVVIGTRATVESGYYQRTLNAEGIAASELALLIEDGHWDDEVIRSYLNSLLPHGEYTLILGCTHYPVLKPVIRELRPKLKIIDPAEVLFENMKIDVREDDSFFAYVYLTRENTKYSDFLKSLGYKEDEFSLSFVSDY